MSKKAKIVRQHTPRAIVSIWLGSLLSLGLLYVAAVAMKSDLGSFRSCNSNSSGLTVSNCGKASLNLGDVVLIGLFVLSACLVVTLFTAAWRTTRRPAK